MKIRCFPAAIIATATLTSYFAPLIFAQDSATSSPVPPPSNPPPVAQPQPQPLQLSSGVEDVLKLSRAKVNEDVIIAFVQNGNRQFSLSATEILYLRREGVSDRVLTAMLGQIPPPATLPPPPESAFAAEAAAPQYISQPATTTYLETPVSTVYVGTPSYYSFYDPWPYWSCWYPYPAFSFGFYWGWGWGGCG